MKIFLHPSKNGCSSMPKFQNKLKAQGMPMHYCVYEIIIFKVVLNLSIELNVCIYNVPTFLVTFLIPNFKRINTNTYMFTYCIFFNSKTAFPIIN